MCFEKGINFELVIYVYSSTCKHGMCEDGMCVCVCRVPIFSWHMIFITITYACVLCVVGRRGGVGG